MNVSRNSDMTGIITCSKGFTLVEMVMVCLLFTLVIGITGDAFNRIVTRSLALNRSAESNVTGMVGLQMMRSDLQAAGYGLPWSFSRSISYSEAAAEPGVALNPASANSVPLAVNSNNNVSSGAPQVVLNLTDTLAIRGHTVAPNTASKRWTFIESQVLPNGNRNPKPHDWLSENLQLAHQVILVAGLVNNSAANQLVVSATGKWNASFANYSTIGKPPVYSDAEKKSDSYTIYGISDDTALSSLRMPFNRADYYVRRPAANDTAWFRAPQRCNPAAGVLVKGVVSQSNGAYSEIPILDCVLDMQVVYTIRTGTTLTDVSDISGLSAEALREQLKEIKVYLLAHDGGLDRGYSYGNATIGVGPGDGLTSGTGSTFDFAARGVPDWRNYHWRVYQIAARPGNLAGTATQ
jgi:hypothetical protein